MSDNQPVQPAPLPCPKWRDLQAVRKREPMTQWWLDNHGLQTLQIARAFMADTTLRKDSA